MSLAACSTGSGQQLASDYANEGLSLVYRYQYSNPTPLWSMPSTGSATYEGIATLDYERTPNSTAELVGAARINADFAGRRTTGSVTEMVDDNDARASGALRMNNGVIQGNLVTGDMRGTITYRGTETTLDLDATGVFAETGARAVLILLEGDAVSNNGFNGSADGAIIAD
jgi:hypothetical protein